MYVKLTKNYEIGYRVFNEETETWSDFYIIDRSRESYIDYSFLPFNNTLYALLIKKIENINILFYYEGGLFNFYSNKVFESNSLISCSLYLIKGKPFGVWISNNNIYHNFFAIRGKYIATPPYCEHLISLQIIKARYISNFIQNKKTLIMSEVYLKSEEDINFLIDSGNYSPILNKDFINYINEIHSKFIN